MRAYSRSQYHLLGSDSPNSKLAGDVEWADAANRLGITPPYARCEFLRSIVSRLGAGCLGCAGSPPHSPGQRTRRPQRRRQSLASPGHWEAPVAATSPPYASRHCLWRHETAVFRSVGGPSSRVRVRARVRWQRQGQGAAAASGAVAAISVSGQGSPHSFDRVLSRQPLPGCFWCHR